MKRRNIGQGKIGAVFLISIMAFAAIGVGYAHWQETLTISGVMTTDDVYPYFFTCESNDWQSTNSMDPSNCGEWEVTSYTPGTANYVVQWGAGRRDKNVGWCDVGVNSENDQILDITIGDAYPCYYAHPFFGIKNKGSAPVLVHGIQLFEVSFDDKPIPVGPIDIMPGQIWGVRINEETSKANVHPGVNNAKDDFSLMLTGDDLIINKQLDPKSWGEDDVVDDHMEYIDQYTDALFGDICIHFENGCEQGTKYDFKIGLVFWNWPEYVQVTPQQIPNTIASSTMIFEGELYFDDVDTYTGTIPMIDESQPGAAGDGEAGFDVYARNGYMAAYDKVGTGQDYAYGHVAIHDAYNTAGGWGTQYDPDCGDWYNYQLTLTGTTWALEYNGNVGNDGILTGASGAPMSGDMDWGNTYASETNAGAYYAGMGTPESDGYALDNPYTGVNDGTQSWDMDWSWGSEYIPLQYPGFDVLVADLGGGSYRVTLTPS